MRDPHPAYLVDDPSPEDVAAWEARQAERMKTYHQQPMMPLTSEPRAPQKRRRPATRR